MFVAATQQTKSPVLFGHVLIWLAPNLTPNSLLEFMDLKLLGNTILVVNESSEWFLANPLRE